MATKKAIGIREAVRQAEDCALGVLDAHDDDEFWGEEFVDEHSDEDNYNILIRARRIIMNRIRRDTHA